MARQEFRKPVRVEIVKRATRNGQTYCEGCGVACSRFEIDHTLADGLRVDKSKPLTADDGKLLCSGTPDSCHGKKTARDVAVIAKAKRAEAKHLGVVGKPTALSGRNRAQIDEHKQERAAARGAKSPVPRPAGYLGSFRIKEDV